MSVFRIGSAEDEDDEETIRLDKKVEDMLKEIATTSANAPEAISKWLEQLSPAGKQPAEVQKTLEGLMQAYRELPDLTSILGNWTATLSAYASYRLLQKQERIARRNLSTTKILAGATVLLALATFALVAVTIFRT